MLSVGIDPNAPYVATITSDLRLPEMPHVVCVAKARFVFCMQNREWSWDRTVPDFQEIDCWDTVPARQVTDLLPEKKQAELLLWGMVKPGAKILRQDNEGLKIVVKTGNLSPEPVLYWQNDWKPRPKTALSTMDFMVAPAYARFAQPWEKTEALRFQGIFSLPGIPIDTIFRTGGFGAFGTLVSSGSQSKIPVCCDSIFVNVDQGYIDMVWRARFPWDLMGERVGVFWLDIRQKN
jgi:hypothetical protein